MAVASEMIWDFWTMSFVVLIVVMLAATVWSVWRQSCARTGVFFTSLTILVGFLSLRGGSAVFWAVILWILLVSSLVFIVRVLLGRHSGSGILFVLAFTVIWGTIYLQYTLNPGFDMFFGAWEGFV